MCSNHVSVHFIRKLLDHFFYFLSWFFVNLFHRSFLCSIAFPEMASDAPSISEWFHGRNVFITGGTGFMGKILIYKLLISCHNIGNIFVLIRKKRDLDPHSRLQQLMQVRFKETLLRFHATGKYSYAKGCISFLGARKGGLLIYCLVF